jgi:hypothetical protein
VGGDGDEARERTDTGGRFRFRLKACNDQIARGERGVRVQGERPRRHRVGQDAAADATIDDQT